MAGIRIQKGQPVMDYKRREESERRTVEAWVIRKGLRESAVGLPEEPMNLE